MVMGTGTVMGTVMDINFNFFIKICQVNILLKA